MSPETETILEDALDLPATERAELIEHLLVSLEANTQPTLMPIRPSHHGEAVDLEEAETAAVGRAEDLVDRLARHSHW